MRDDKYTDNRKVMVCIPTKGEMKTRTTSSLLAARDYCEEHGVECQVFFAEGTIVPAVRTKLIEEFIKYPKFTHMLFIDSDQTFDRHYIMGLLNADKDIVGAPSRIRSGEVYNVYMEDKETGRYKAFDNLNGLGLRRLSKTLYRDWETDRKSTRLNSSHLKLSRMPSSA